MLSAQRRALHIGIGDADPLGGAAQPTPGIRRALQGQWRHEERPCALFAAADAMIWLPRALIYDVIRGVAGLWPISTVTRSQIKSEGDDSRGSGLKHEIE